MRSSSVAGAGNCGGNRRFALAQNSPSQELNLSNLRETEKAHRELRAFHDFADRSALLIDPELVEKRDPPEPDILCRHLLEGWTAFELADLCDANIASRLNRTDGPVVEVFMTSDPSLAIVQKKLSKEYRSAHPVELLVYSTGRIITPDDVIVPTIRPYVESHPETVQARVVQRRLGSSGLRTSACPVSSQARLDEIAAKGAC